MTTASFWDAEAGAFRDQPGHGLRDLLVRVAWTGFLLPLLPPSPSRVADLACGTGSLSLLVAEAGHHVSGLEISPAMVPLARADLLKRGGQA